jgi:hemolysin III
MSALSEPPNPASHYISRAERIADGWVHGVGLAIAGIGAALLIALSAWRGGMGEASAILVYSACLLAMLGVSAAYNLADRSRLRLILCRLDHAAIFVMIAGSYTPFTTQRFDGAWAIGMTLAVWLIALVGAAGKLFLRGIPGPVWLVFYVLLGWMVVIAIDPLFRNVSLGSLILLVAGGAIYTSGVAIYVLERLPFRRAIWHGFVITAAGTHYAAILTGVVLA